MLRTQRRKRIQTHSINRHRHLQLEKLEPLQLLTSLWQNPVLAEDVNSSGAISLVDALTVVADLRHNGLPHVLSAPDGNQSPPPFLNVSGGDDVVNLSDALLVVSAMRTGLTLPTPAIDASLVSDTGRSRFDAISSEALLGGTVENAVSATHLVARVDSGPWQRINLNEAGSFSFDPSFEIDGSDDGEHTVEFVSQALGGPSSTKNVSFQLDTTPPSPPSIALDEGSDTAPVGDSATTQSLVTLVGQSEPAAILELPETGIQTIADSAGNFKFSAVALTPGTNTLNLTVIDAAGNRSDVETTFTRLPQSGDIHLVEGENLVVEQREIVEFGQVEGKRRIHFDVETNFGMSDPMSASGDTFLVYLMDSAESPETLLDRGQPGTALFAISENSTEYAPGLVQFDGQTVSIDVSSIDVPSQGVLLFQLINTDDDDGSQVVVSPLRESIDPQGSAAVALPSSTEIAASGNAMDTSLLSVASDVEVQLSNSRFDSEIGSYVAELRLHNQGDSLGRTLGIVFPGLPEGVTLSNASGTTLSGDPYLNVTPAIANGGLQFGDRSLWVELTISDPSLARFSLDPHVLTGPTNRPPLVSPIDALTLMPGDVLDVPLAISDADGDSTSYSIHSESNLPTYRLESDRIIFQPLPSQVGEYEVLLTATDGALESSQSFLLEVVPDPIQTTRVSGHVLNTNEEPLGDVPIELAGFSTTTAADGSFTIELPSLIVPTEDFSITVPVGDVYLDPFNTGAQTIPVRRTPYDPDTGTSRANPRRHSNSVTSFIDGSMIYGSDDQRAAALRTGVDGRLKTSAGDLLPLNDSSTFPSGTLENDNQGRSDPSLLFAAGDVRANENVALQSLQTLLVREHNRLADELKVNDSSLTDEQIYQQARRLVGAIVQHITYTEYLPVLLGAGTIVEYGGYDPDVDSTESALFAVAAYRTGHSQVFSEIQRLDPQGQSLPGGPLAVREAFFDPQPVKDDGIEPYLRGLRESLAEEVDPLVIDDLRNFLFGPPGSGGMDLAAMNIQRGREIGLPGYNQARIDFGLPAATSFGEITSDAELAADLESLYGDVDNLDVWIGGLAEDHAPGALVGSLFQTIIADQFTRARDGDRFWYENGQLTVDQLNIVRSSNLAALIERNTSISGLPQELFTTSDVPQAPGPGGEAAIEEASQYRDIAGLGNNIDQVEWGAAHTNLLTNFTLDYGDGISTPTGTDRPNARTISNAIMAQDESVPNANNATGFAVFWGQLIDHDLGHTPGGVSDTLKVLGNERPDPAESEYPFVAEPLPLLLGREVVPGINNSIARPIYLPALDIEGGTVIDPDQDTMVEQELSPGETASLMVTAGSLQNRQGEPFDDVLSITQVPRDLTPASLPEGMEPDTVVTIQPAEMTFAQPAPLSLPNNAGLAPGITLNLWSINPITGEFEIVGAGTVSSDGESIDTTEGGVRSSSWHFFAIDPVGYNFGTDPYNLNQGCTCSANQQASRETSSDTQLHSGDLIESHALPSYHSIGVERSTVLTYDSGRLPTGRAFHYQFPELGGEGQSISTGGGSVLTRLQGALTISRGDQPVGSPVVINEILASPGQQSLFTGLVAPRLAQAYRNRIYVDTSAFRTGQYTATLQLGIYTYIDGELATGSTAGTQEWEFLQINSRQSPYGAGWGISGLQRIFLDGDGPAILVDGDGTEIVFPQTAGSFQSPPGDFSTLERLPGGGLRRTMPDRMVYEFDTNGRLTTVTDRNGNATNYQYEELPSGQLGLATMIDPVGLETTFQYANGLLNSITDPADRTTMVEHSERNDLVSIVDPDDSGRTFFYDSRHRMTGEIDKRGFRETVEYNSQGQAIRTVRRDGTTVSVEPVQTTRSEDEAIARFIDGNGNPTEYVLNQEGLVGSIRDGEGAIAAIERDVSGLVRQAIDPRGVVERYEYDANGKVVEIDDTQSLATEIYPGEQFYFGKDFSNSKMADVNNDGRLDIVGRNGSGIVVSFANDFGGFLPAFKISVSGQNSNGNGFDLADFDNNGSVDIALSTWTSNRDGKIVILLNDGEGSFTNAGAIPLTMSTGLVEAKDINGDGNIDIARLDNFGADEQLSLLAGDGQGNFSPLDPILIGNNPTDFRLIDINDDQNHDLVISDGSADYITVRLGAGNGHFGEAVTYSVGDGPEHMEVIDIDSDGILDIVSLNRSSGDLSFLRGLADGDFATESRIVNVLPSSQWLAESMAFGDIDLDGSIDIAISASDRSNAIDDGQVVVLHGDGTGGFTQLDNVDVGDANRGELTLFIRDVTGDGQNDLVGAWNFATIFPGKQGSSPFPNEELFGGGRLGDVNNDGATDVVGYSIYLGDNLGGFTYSSGGPFQVEELADFNNDGNLDAVSSSRASFGDGTGMFSSPLLLDFGSQSGSAEAIAVGDMNNDGYPDVVGSQVSVLLSDGGGDFESALEQPIESNSRNVALGDFNLDGDLDVVTLNAAFPATVTVLLGNGDGTLQLNAEYELGGRISFDHNDIDVSDLNGDAIPDVVVPLSSSNQLAILMGTGQGDFEPIRYIDSLAENPWEVTVTDLNDDGLVDIITGNASSNASVSGDWDNIEIFYGDGIGGFPQRRLVAADGVLSIQVADLNGDSSKDLLIDGRRDFVLYGVANQPIVRHFEYDPTYSQLTRAVDELGRETLYDIDPTSGNARSITQVVGEVDDASNGETDDIVTRFTYTSVADDGFGGLVETITDPLERTSLFEYDALGRITTITFALGTADEAERSFEYDLAGNLTVEIDENQHSTEYQYDELNRVTQLTEADPDGDGPLTSPISTFAYDANGNLVEASNAEGSTTVNQYDAMDRLISSRDDLFNTTRYRYDNEGNPVAIIDSLGNMATAGYDQRNRLVAITDPEGAVTDFSYDGVNNLTSVTDPNDNVTRYSYDFRNRLVSELDPLGKASRYAYDAVDNLVSRTNRNGQVASFEFDALDRVTAEAWRDEGGTLVNEISYEYDKASNLLAVDDYFSQLSFQYDERNRAVAANNSGTPNAPHVLLEYEFDDMGYRTSLTDVINGEADAQTTYLRDALHRLVSISQTGAVQGNDVQEKRVDFTYDQDGHYASIDRYADLDGLQSVIQSSFEYDNVQRLKALRHASQSGEVAFYELTYDASGRIASLNDIDGLTEFSYDNRAQITAVEREETDPRGDESYVYDSNGNRSESHLHAEDYQTGEANRMLSDGTYNYSYDAEGNLVQRTEIASGDYRQLAWDLRNRLVEVTDSTAGEIILQQITYVYDVFNRRIAQKVDTTPDMANGEAVTHFVYDDEDVLLEFVDPDGSGPSVPELANRYLHGPGSDHVLAQEQPGEEAQWLLTDYLGSTRDLVDFSGETLNHISYDSYGNVVSESDPSNSTRHLFTGREFDAATGLYYYRTRYYDAAIGRFLSEDPTRYAGGDANLYRYAHNIPNYFVDPYGKESAAELFGDTTTAFSILGWERLLYGAPLDAAEAVAASKYTRMSAFAKATSNTTGLLKAQTQHINALENSFNFSNNTFTKINNSGAVKALGHAANVVSVVGTIDTWLDDCASLDDKIWSGIDTGVGLLGYVPNPLVKSFSFGYGIGRALDNSLGLSDTASDAWVDAYPAPGWLQDLF